MRATVLIAALLTLAAFGSTTDGLTDLRQSFVTPPDDSRIMMRWWWFGPSVTKPGLARELETMKAGGIGGVEIQPVYPVALDDPARGIRNLTFLSDEFIEALRFANGKARDLGLRVDLTVGSGWPHGGPTVAIDHAAGKLRVERTSIAAGARQIAVPSIGAGERLLAVFLVSSPPGPTPASPREMTDVRDRVVLLPADAEGEVVFFIASRTGMMVKRPAIGAEGFVLNHYDRPALDQYLRTVGDRLLQAFGPTPPHAVFCDSLEVYESDWTADFLDEFRQRRGYDLKPHLPALAAGADSRAGGLRHDWGQTLTELLNERFVTPMREWAHSRRTQLRMQAYGIPPATISTGALVDLPEGEGAQWRTLSATRWASSASHIYGRPVTSSETWTWLHSPSFRATPLDVKAEADLHFLQGINQLIGHGWPYTADGVEYPGWRFYAAGVFNDKNPWWIVMPDVSRYLQRVSFLLRQGTPVADVAIYLPIDDAWAHFAQGRVNMIETLRERIGGTLVGAVLDAGFAFDFVDDETLRTNGRVENGALRIGRGAYRAIVLPGVERMPPESLRRLREFAGQGGRVIATRTLPELAPGFKASDADHAAVRDHAAHVFQSAAPGGVGRLVADEALAGERLKQGGQLLTPPLQPDVAFSPAAPDIGFVHRHTDEAEIYFLANTGNLRRSTSATLRVTGMAAEWWDPINGRIEPAAVQPVAEGGTRVALDLEPYGSRVLVFSKSKGSIRAQQDMVPAVVRLKPDATGPGTPQMEWLDISTGWRVTFEPGGAPVTMDRLRSWTDDETRRYFSGVATYEKTVVVPDRLIGRGRVLRLDFGEGQAIPPQPLRSGMHAWLDAPVREAAIVSVNDERVGSIWCPPYSIDVTAALRPGPNRIRIAVGNLAINDMAGHALPNYRLLNLRYGVRFEPQDMDKVQPVPAGLLGPIRLIAASTR